MALTHRVTTSVRSNAGTVTSSAYTLTGTAETNVELESLAIGTDVAQDFTSDVSTIVSLAISWEPDTGSSSLTMKTNNSGAPDDTLTILADNPLIWNTTIEDTIGTACPLTVDVTGLFLTNSVAGDLSIYVLHNGS
jgi:hypothetical protein